MVSTLVTSLTLNWNTEMMKLRKLQVSLEHMSNVMGKAVLGISDQSRHKAGCTATEGCSRLEILDAESRCIVLSM